MAWLQARIAAAPPGSTVRVPAGCYQGNLWIRHPVTLVATGPVVLDGGNRGTVVTLAAPHIILKGFVIMGTGDDKEALDSGIMVEPQARGAVVEDCHIRPRAFGIWVKGARDVRILHNAITGFRREYLERRGYGIELWNTINALVEGNRISQTLDGVYVIASAYNKVYGNRLWALRYGIHDMSVSHDVYTGNRISRCWAGIALMTARWMTIASNYITRTGFESAILFRDAYYNRAYDNVLVNNSIGFIFYDAVYNRLTGNLIVNNRIGAHVWGGSYPNTVIRNTFIGNAWPVEYLGTHSIVWTQGKTGNYWSGYAPGGLVDGTRPPYRASNAIDRIEWRYPMTAWVLADNPVLRVLQVMAEQFPALQAPSVIDQHPLLTPAFPHWRRILEHARF
ncbi:MAG: nitrous oxide reductase family maturation protein NosD [Firmicutes bacterium]|nr:nitrous oxide reductase family maturation protein NosD [Bacillota bacterium]